MLSRLSSFFDLLHHLWDHPRSERLQASVLICLFILGFLGIQMNRWGLLAFLPPDILAQVPLSHFQAVHLAFSMLLFLELMGLIFAVPYSISRAIAKQLEILALILLRNAFKELTYFHDPMDFALDQAVVPRIVVSSIGALLVFCCLGIYNRMPRYHNYMPPQEVVRYVMWKKMLSLGLMAAVAYLVVLKFLSFLAAMFPEVGMLASMKMKDTAPAFFENVYTILIFADILMVLVAQRFLPNFQALFRNSGYVIATLLMRISFAAPAYFDTIVGVIAAGYALLLTWAVSAMHQQAEGEKTQLSPPPA